LLVGELFDARMSGWERIEQSRTFVHRNVLGSRRS
jgi:hypothetical protein